MSRYLASLLCAMAVCFGVVDVSAQYTRIYVQRSTGAQESSYSLAGMGQADTNGRMFGLLKKGGFLFFDPTARQAWIDTSYATSRFMDYGSMAPFGRGSSIVMRSEFIDLCRYHPDSGFVNIPISDSLKYLTGHGAYHLPGGSFYHEVMNRISSPDGHTWFQLPDSLVGYDYERNDIGSLRPSLYSRISGRYFEADLSRGSLDLVPIPLKRTVIRYARVHSDTVVGILSGRNGKRTVWYGAIGDTSATEITTMLDGSTSLPIDPLYVNTLASGAALYVDKSLRYGKVEGGQINLFQGQFPGSLIYSTPADDEVAVSAEQNNWTVMKLTDPPTWETWKHGSFMGTVMPELTLGKGFGTVYRVEPHEFIRDFPGRKLIVTGSLLGPLPIGSLQYRRMFYCHEPERDRRYVYVDSDILVDASSSAATLVVANILRGINNSTVGYDYSTTWTYPKHGISMSVVNDTTLLFPGRVVRTVSTSGRFPDTLLARKASMVGMLHDGTIVSGDSGVVRFHHATLDTFQIPVPELGRASAMGLPSSAIRAEDGSLVCSFLGINDLPIDSVESIPLRWGGIMRSEDNGSTWSPVSLPNDRSNHILGIKRLRSGSLVSVAENVINRRWIDSTWSPPQPRFTYGLSDVTIIRSTDNGRSWTQVHRAFYNGAYRVCTGNMVEWTHDGSVDIATPGGVFHSTDEGATWTNEGPIQIIDHPISVSKGADGSLLISTTTGVYRREKTSSIHDDETAKTSLRVVPSIAQSSISIELSGELQSHDAIQKIVITDVSGRIVDDATHTTRNVSAWANGLYLVTVTTTTTSYTAPFVKCGQ